MVLLTPKQEQNLREALGVTDNLAERERLAFGIWSESKARIYANDGTNESDSPGFDTHPQWPEILRRSLKIPHDAIGNNGRSTGMLQQISADVGGAWGDMAGTMNPKVSALRFLTRLRVTDNPIYEGWLQTPTGREWVKVDVGSIAADVLRVQQPLANEARSKNYDATQVAIAKAIVAQLFPVVIQPDLLEDTMADRHPFIWFRYDGSMWEADVWNKTYSRIPNDQTLEDRKFVLALANFPPPVEWKDLQEDKGDVTNPAAFGREVPWTG